MNTNHAQEIFPRGFATATFDTEADLPDPPDNFDEWNALPEEHREKVANQFTRGIDHEYDLIRARVKAEYASARARQVERDRIRAAAEARRNSRGRR